MNRSKILRDTIRLMEIAEGMIGDGPVKLDYVLTTLKDELGHFYNDYEEEIKTLIEAVIFITKFKENINVNKVKRGCKGCFKF